MANVLDTLRSRGFVKQVVFEEDLYKLLDSQSVTFYSGFDPTADSLHVGTFRSAYGFGSYAARGPQANSAGGRRYGYNWRPFRQN